MKNVHICWIKMIVETFSLFKENKNIKISKSIDKSSVFWSNLAISTISIPWYLSVFIIHGTLRKHFHWSESMKILKFHTVWATFTQFLVPREKNIQILVLVKILYFEVFKLYHFICFTGLGVWKYWYFIMLGLNIHNFEIIKYFWLSGTK